MTIGDYIRELRLRRGYKLKELASSCSISVPFMSQIEHNTRKASSERLSAILDALASSAAERQMAARLHAISVNRFRIVLPDNPTEEDRELANELSLCFNALSKAQKQEIRRLLPQ